ncbi:MAG: serine/threonine-protein kinase [Kofleriaceae bacterium]
MTRHRTADLEPMQFGGRYTLLRRLAVGGMAEIYLARQAAMAGFEKEVVIKKLRVELADDPRIVEMFLDEAKIGAQLNHPNIVHVYDVDEHDGIPYIAMEYIVGEELNELCRRGIGFGRFLPLEHAVEVMRQAAAGLGYFHAKRGAEGSALAGQPLDIVHLDISPSNLLVTQDGFMKVIDFGIARARGQNTRSEVLPGKLSYMSPEQAARKAVDHRSDIFSLGIVLYEITVGKRLYRGAAQDVVHALIDGEVEPPTFARRNFPPALESIVMRTLEKHPEDRYQSAYDLADDLEAFLRDERLHSGPVRIARYLDMLALAAGGARRPELISEAEARATGEELDFDSQVFDGFAPSEGAPGPEQAPMWEDIEQPESEVAKALQIDLAELRSLRTPVPVRPGGMAAVRGSGVHAAVGPLAGEADPADQAEAAEQAPATAPVPRLYPAEVYPADNYPDDAVPELAQPDDGSIDVDIQTPPKPIPAVRARARTPVPIRTPFDPGAVVQPVVDQPSIGAAYLARSQGPSRMPWLVSAVLAVVVLALLAYIVLQ